MRRTKLVGLVFGFALLVAGAVQGREPTTISIQRNARVMEIQETRPGAWTCRADGNRLVVEVTGGDVKLLRDGRRVAAGKVDGARLEVTGADGAAVFSFKFYPDKTKVFLPGRTDPIEFKRKEDKVKVVVKGEEVGKVKYYGDTGKLKAKNAAGEVVAQTRDMGRLSAALAPFVVADLNEDLRIQLCLVLLALGK